MQEAGDGRQALHVLAVPTCSQPRRAAIGMGGDELDPGCMGEYIQYQDMHYIQLAR